MKTVIKYFTLLIVLHSFTWMVPPKASAQVSVSFQVFYDDLSPYGDWVDNPDYGYVWVPNVTPGFTPYGTNGYWVFTDAGWTWVSNYSWGWAPFHYGRWYSDPEYGYVWVPGNEWGPGWVTWRRSDDYYGWAPIGPGISIDIAYSSSYNVPFNQWRFVRNRDFGRTNITNYYVNSSSNTTIINNTTVINNVRDDRSRNVRYNQGPDRFEAQRRSGKKFTPVVVRERVKPGQNLGRGELQIYRPRMENNNTTGRKPAPSNIRTWSEVRPAAQRDGIRRPNQPNNQQPSQGRGDKPPLQQQPQSPRKRIDQSPTQQPARQKRNDQPVRQQPSQPIRSNPPPRQQPVQQKRNDQPVRQQPSQPIRSNPPPRQQPVQQERNDQPVRQQPSQPIRSNPPQRQQPIQQKRNDQPARQQPSQPVRNNPPPRQQPVQPKRNDQPAKQQPAPPKRNDQRSKQSEVQTSGTLQHFVMGLKTVSAINPQTI
jgi:hypothetical protein